MNTFTENRYDKRLEEMLAEFCPYYHEFTEKTRIQAIFSKMEAYDKAPWAIFGAGVMGEWLCERFDLSQFQNFRGFLDNNSALYGQDFHGFPVMSPRDTSVFDLDGIGVAVAQHNQFQAICEELHPIHPKATVTHFFEASYRYQGYQVCDPRDYFYHSRYADTYVMERLWYHATNEEEKKKYLEILIERYLHIRDFVHGFDSIDKYVELYGKGHYDLLKEQLQALLTDLERNLKQRSQRDIFMVLLDNLGFDKGYDRELLPYLNELAESGLKFEQAYAAALYTSESVSAMCKKTPLVRLKKQEESNGFPLKDILEENGYFSQALSTSPIKIVEPGGSARKSLYTEPIVFQQVAIAFELPRQYWLAITSMAENEKKTFSWLHAITETHVPHHCGHYHLEQDVLAQVEKGCQADHIFVNAGLRYPPCLRYVDQISAFYLSLLGESAVKVIFADHGNWVYEPYTLEMRKRASYAFKAHVPIILHGGGIEPQVDGNLFSSVNMVELLQGVMDGSLEYPSSEYVKYGLLSIREEKLRAVLPTYASPFCLSGVQGILDQDYIMERNGQGEYRYFLASDDTNEVEDPAIIAKIQERFGHLFLEDDCYDSFGS